MLLVCIFMFSFILLMLFNFEFIKSRLYTFNNLIQFDDFMLNIFLKVIIYNNKNKYGEDEKRRFLIN